MAGKTKLMSQIKQLMLLHQQGKSKKEIARTLSISRNTVKSYLRKLKTLTQPNKGLSIQQLVKLPEPELEAKFHAGNPAYKKEQRYEDLTAQMDYFLKELKRVGVTKYLLWEEYKQNKPDGYRYSQFCYHLQQYQIAANPTMVLTHQAGEKLYIDFTGKKLSYIDKQTGEVIECEVFAACLPYSDYGFAMAVKSQTIPDFLHALACCLEALGGVPAALVPDNLKSAVIKSSKYEPDINQALEDFANHYGTTVVPARAKKPRDKALVENHVQIIYSRVYAKLRNQQFFDLETLNQAIKEKMMAHNQTRMQQKPYCREERFLAEEKSKLKPLPAQRFELKKYKLYTVGKNNHICLNEDKHYYSVPFQHIGKRIKVIYTRSMVHIYDQGKQIAVHTRDIAPGQYTTVKEHLCSQHQFYKDRSPAYYIRLAKKKSPVLETLITKVFEQDKYPEQLYKTCDGLFSLYRMSEHKTFEKACQIALDNQMYSYKFILNILTNKTTQYDEDSTDQKPLPSHDNVRGKAYYQEQINFKP